MRRGHLIGNLAVAILIAGFCVSARADDTNSQATVAEKSRVVLVRDASAVSEFTVDDAKAGALVSAGIKAWTGEKDEAAAWRHFVSVSDVVGIKISTQN